MKLSIIIPVYNGQRYIRQAYNEIKGQNIKVSYELIFVDNNSNDSSIEQIKSIMVEHENIHLFLEGKQGAGAARNCGIRNAKGEFIYCFDVDDKLFPNSLNSLVNTLINNPEIDTVYGKLTRDIKDLNEYRTDIDSAKVKIQRHPHLGLFWFSHFSKLVGPPAFMHRKTVFNDLGFYPEEILVGEDAAFHIRVGLLKTLGFMDKFIYYYNRHPESTVSVVHAKQDRLYTYWKQYVKHYIPYSTKQKLPDEFYTLLKRKVFTSYAKILQRTKGFKERKLLSKKLKEDIKPMQVGIINGFLIWIIVYTKSIVVLKILLRLLVSKYKNVDSYE